MSETPNPIKNDASNANLMPTPAELRKIRRLKANNYRNMYLLPRFVEEENGEKRKLEAGEFDPKSKLYPLSTPIKDMSDFGVGLGMYFTTTMWFGLMMFMCAIIQTPTATYFNSKKYDKQNEHDTTLKNIGSASCLDETRVCLDADCTTYAGEFHFPSDSVPRFSPSYDPIPEDFRDADYHIYDDDVSADSENGVAASAFGAAIGKADKSIVITKDKITVGLRHCELKRFFGTSDFIMMIFISCVLLGLGYWQNKEAEALDLAEQTAQDYSVIIEDPNPEAVDPDEWKDFFEERFGPVFMVTVCLNNGKLLNLFKQKRAIENEMALEAIEEEKYAKAKRRASSVDEGFLAQLQMNQSAKSYFKQFMELIGLDPTLEYFTMQLLKTNMNISKLKHSQYQACKVYVIFNTEASQRSCLESMCVGAIPAALDWTSEIDPKFLYKGNLLAIKEAPEPSSVLYENLDRGFKDHVIEQAISWTLLACGLIVTYFTIDSLFKAGQPVMAALAISFWNGVLPEVNRYLVMEFETHHTTEEIEDSFLSKTVAARWFTSSIILYVVGLDHSSQMLSPYYIGSIQAVLLADALTSPIIRLMDVAGNAKRWILAPIAGTDDRAKAFNQGTDWLLAERYTDLAKTVLMSLFFSAIFPVGYWYSALACFICFWVDKYCVLRLFRQKPPAGDRLVRVTRTFTAVVVLIHAIITSHFYYSWPFDNLCPTSTVLTSAGEARAANLGVPSNYYTVYKQCNQISDSLLPPPVKEDWFQSDGEQAKLVYFFNVVSILMVVYICVAYFGSDASTSVYALFYYKHDAVGEATDISYDTVTSGEGYVPQFILEGMAHSILCCVAPIPKEKELNGGLEFDPYLLNWTASKERTGEENEEELAEDLTPEEIDSVYRKFNIYFDDQLEAIDEKNKNTCVLARAKQYIKNTATSEAGAFAMTAAGRARASTAAKDERSANSVSLAKRVSLTLGSIKATVVGTPATATGNADLEKMADDDEARRGTTQYPADMPGGTYT
jgi:hypothetical protein